MSIIASLITQVGCDVSNLLEGFDKSKSATKSYAGEIGAIAGGNLIASGVEQGIEMIKKLGESIIEAAEEMKALTLAAQKFGIGTDTMQTLGFAAEEANQEIGDLEKAMKKASSALVDPDKAKLFQQLGIDAQRLTGMGIDKQFETIRDRIMEIGNVNDRLKMASDIFGKGGAGALNVDVGDAKKQQNEMGGVVDSQAVERLTQFEAEWGKLMMGIKNTGIKLLAIFADVARGVLIVVEGIVSTISQFVNGIENLYQSIAGKSNLPPVVNTESSEAAIKLGEDIDALTSKLEKERDTMGMSAEQAEIWALKKRGATDAQLAHIQALEKSNAAVKKGMEEEKRMTAEIEKQQEAREKALEQRAKSITDTNKTPEEKFKDDMAELNTMLIEGRISWETYDRAAQKAAGTLGKVSASNATANMAIDFGSQKMYDLLAKLVADQEQKDYQDKLLKQAEIQNEKLGIIAENTSQPAQVATI